MSFHYPRVNYQIPLHFRLKRGEPPLKSSTGPVLSAARRRIVGVILLDSIFKGTVPSRGRKKALFPDFFSHRKKHRRQEL